MKKCPYYWKHITIMQPSRFSPQLNKFKSMHKDCALNVVVKGGRKNLTLSHDWGNCSMGVKNLKSLGNSSAARGYMSLYDCRMVTSATPAMSPISF